MNKEQREKLAREVGYKTAEKYLCRGMLNLDDVCEEAALEALNRAVPDYEHQIADLIQEVHRARVHGPRISKVIGRFGNALHELQVIASGTDSVGLVLECAVPDGYVVVPVEPTMGMLAEGVLVVERDPDASFRDVYKAMLKAGGES